MWESVDSVDSVGVLHGKWRNFADLAQKTKKRKGKHSQPANATEISLELYNVATICKLFVCVIKFKVQNVGCRNTQNSTTTGRFLAIKLMEFLVPRPHCVCVMYAEICIKQRPFWPNPCNDHLPPSIPPHPKPARILKRAQVSFDAIMRRPTKLINGNREKRLRRCDIVIVVHHSPFTIQH